MKDWEYWKEWFLKMKIETIKHELDHSYPYHFKSPIERIVYMFLADEFDFCIGSNGKLLNQYKIGKYFMVTNSTKRQRGKQPTISSETGL